MRMSQQKDVEKGCDPEKETHPRRKSSLAELESEKAEFSRPPSVITDKDHDDVDLTAAGDQQDQAREAVSHFEIAIQISWLWLKQLVDRINSGIANKTYFHTTKCVSDTLHIQHFQSPV